MSPMQRIQLVKAAVAVGLVCLVLGVFAQVRTHDFVDLDDLGGIEGNPDLEADSWLEGLEKAVTLPFLSNWIPVTVLSHQLDRRLHGPTGGAHQLTNVAIHAVASALLFLALSSLTRRLWLAAFVAAVFAVHPLHVETVAWVSERKGVLSGLFFAATLLAHARYVERPGWSTRIAVYTALLLALLSKPTAVTLPFVLLLLDAWPLGRLGWPALREKLPMLALVAVVSVVTFVVQRATGAMVFGEPIPLGPRLANGVSAYAVYLQKTFWPTGLTVFYPYPKGGPDLAQAALSALLLGSVTLWFLRLRRSRPYLLVGWLWFGGMLVPTLGIVQVGEQAYADRYMYLPLIGLSICVAWGVADLARGPGWRRLVAGVGALTIALLAVTSWAQLPHWRDSWALWKRVLEVTPGNPRALFGLGSLHGRLRELEDTERYYLAAYESDPEWMRPRLGSYFLGKSSYLRKRGDAEGALESLRLAVRYDPQSADAHESLGRALARLGLEEEARLHLERAFGDERDDAVVPLVLASAAEASGRLADAVRLRREVSRIAPDLSENTNDLAWLLATAPDADVRDPVEAVRLAEGLVRASASPSGNLLDTLAACYAAAGRFDAAAEAAGRAVARARAEGDPDVAAQAEARRILYRAGTPYVQAARTPRGGAQ
jgi:tetratricopeptide (TPR) repeat protein